MKIFLHIGLPFCGAEQIQNTLNDKRGQLMKKGVLFPMSPGRKNHTRLLMAMTDPDHIDPLRLQRGHAPARKQSGLRDNLRKALKAEVSKSNPLSMILSAHQLSSVLVTESELTRLRDFLLEFGRDITIVMHLQEQARVLLGHYGESILQGRYESLAQELTLKGDGWFDAAMAARKPFEPQLNQFPEIQAPPFWLDYTALVARWQGVFGETSVRCRPYDPALFASRDLIDEITASFDLPIGVGKGEAQSGNDLPSAATMARARKVNGYLLQLMEQGKILDRQIRQKITKSVAVDGPPIDAGALSGFSSRFESSNARLMVAFPALGKTALAPSPETQDWQEEPVESDFNPRKLVQPFSRKIDKLTKEHRAEMDAITTKRAEKVDRNQFMSETGKKYLPNAAKKELAKLAVSRFCPHNRLGSVDETAEMPQYTPIEPRKLRGKSTGNVIVACMKNEAPYIIEWIAYHRAIGVDGFIIYTNGCEDGTTEILDRLQEMGVLIHEDNNDWKGNSPQQAALNRAVKHPLVTNAEWVAHIDVDEFINVRFGNGTLPEFLDRIGDATNVAMTWRLFGHNGVLQLADKPVIEQFTGAAPKYCPKPHTVWGFKTLYRNINAYEKISCHRTTKLREGKRDQVKWVNGNGAPIGGSIADGGWRSSVKSIGYDLIQLNHYALRSAESYLIKRQRGRALHVDRSIGVNYWLRMDFNQHKDITIQRNLDRTNAEIARLKSDDTLVGIHQQGLKWHEAKAKELHKNPEFEELYQQALDLDLNDLERVAWCLSNDLES